MVNSTPITVLIVDDNRTLLSILSEGLVLAGPFRVVMAENGIEGLEVFEREHPDCVIIDVKMPDLDGYQLVLALRGDPASAQTPLIMLTAMTQDHDRLRGMFTGVDLYMLKPVKPRELANAIYTILGRTPDERLQAYKRLALGEDQAP